MPHYKLTYFNVTGLTEPLRFMLHYGGADFEDNRIAHEEWSKMKAKMPMEQLPTLEVDGKVYHQSRAIGRYLAKKFNLYGSDDCQALEIDAAVDDIEDMRLLVAKFFREEDAALKAKLKSIAEEKLPFYLKKLEEQVNKNGGYLIAKKLTWADIHFSGMSELLSNILERNIIQDYPALKKLNETVRSNPKIKAYLEKRPKTVL